MNILLSFAGGRTDMIQYFKQAAGNTGKVYACDCMFNYSLTLADGYLITPQTCDDSYISILTDYCEKNNISAIIPLSDNDLSILSKNKNKIQNIGISVIVSDESVINICIDRWKMHLFLKSAGIRQPRLYIDPDLAKQDFEAGTLSFPLYLEPRLITERTIEIVVVDSPEEFDLFYRKMQKNMSLQNDRNIIIQEDITGIQYGLCLLNDLKGNYVTSVSLQKLKTEDVDATIGQVEDSRPFQKVINILSSELRYIACLEVDCIMQESGEPVILEIYPRFGYNYPFWQVAGVDFPKQIISWLNGKPTSSGYITPEIGVKGCRETSMPVFFECGAF